MVAKALEALDTIRGDDEYQGMIDGCHNDIACQFEDSPQLQRLLNDLQGEEMLIQDVVSYAVREGFAARRAITATE